jgi:putative ATPase
MNLFTQAAKAPLSERMRPRDLKEFVGQAKVVAENSLLSKMIESDEVFSMIFWGPPGVGKTTLARIIANKTQAKWVPFSAVTAGIKEIKSVMAEAETFFNFEGRRTILFVDEIHRFNKAQQDAFLPYVEKGTIVLIGATTENPSFEVNSALLSRMKVIVLEELSLDDLVTILDMAAQDKERGLGELEIEYDRQMLEYLAVAAGGDARSALNSLELAFLMAKQEALGSLTKVHIKESIQQAVLKHDKDGENHYNLISALHKSMRNSDCDATLYWLARMLEAGEDPIYIARRIVRFASEDIGLAHPQALSQALAAMQAVDLIGLPEGKIILAQAAVYMAMAPKSNAIYRSYDRASRLALETAAETVPLHLRNAPTKLMKDIGYGDGYKYAHNYEDAKTDMQCMPEKLVGKKLWKPGKRGFEGKVSASSD